MIRYFIGTFIILTEVTKITAVILIASIAFVVAISVILVVGAAWAISHYITKAIHYVAELI